MRLTQAMKKKKKKKRDDVESVDNESTMSTSSNLEPFANDNLGIVLHQKWVAVGKRGAETCDAVLEGRGNSWSKCCWSVQHF